MRQAGLIADHFDHIRVLKIRQRINGMRGRADAGLRRVHQKLGDGTDQFRWHQRLVTLNVDHNVLVLQAQQVAGLGQPVAATGVVGAGQHCRHAVVLTGLHDQRAVRGHHHPSRASAGDAFCYTHHHWFAGNIG